MKLNESESLKAQDQTSEETNTSMDTKIVLTSWKLVAFIAQPQQDRLHWHLPTKLESGHKPSKTQGDTVPMLRPQHFITDITERFRRMFRRAVPPWHINGLTGAHCADCPKENTHDATSPTPAVSSFPSFTIQGRTFLRSTCSFAKVGVLCQEFQKTFWNIYISV